MSWRSLIGGKGHFHHFQMDDHVMSYQRIRDKPEPNLAI
jgi:hypothetical protein